MERLFYFYSFVCFVLVISRSFCYSFVNHLCSPTEAFALLHFKQPLEINDDYSENCDTPFPKTNFWNESMDCCTWDGVTCDLFTGHVIGLDLSCSQVSGNILPNSTLFQLHHLHTLNLANNDFYPSSIPNGIGRLRNLSYLNLSDSYFVGEIPTEISHLSKLVSLDLSTPSWLYATQLDQTTFETVLQNFTNLEAVSLSGINTSSPIPMNMSSSLRYLDLTATNSRSVLTESFFLLPNLENLKLTNNDLLKGVLPKIHSSSTLLELDISYTGISGELPYSIGNLSSLNRLYLKGCQFSGPIPHSIGNLTQIRELILSQNNFTGHIPSTISNLKKLTSLNLASNSFGGKIPDVFSNFQQLSYLDLSSNSFIGPFPSSILSLTHLESLNLLGNSLSGPLPSNVSMLQRLTKLDLSYNSLNGTIPSWVFGLPLLINLRLHHNRFSGVADELKMNPAVRYLC